MPQPQQLMAEGLRREHLCAAFRRGQANKGAPGVDGMRVEELPAHLRPTWPAMREPRRSETYVPAPVRAVYLPKPGGGTRMRGIPTVLDRLIAPALLQGLGPICDADFSERSYGFRPGRSAPHALEQACRDMADGYRGVVPLDLEKVFDSVPHAMGMSRGARKGKAKRLLRLIRRYRNAGMMQEG